MTRWYRTCTRAKPRGPSPMTPRRSLGLGGTGRAAGRRRRWRAAYLRALDSSNGKVGVIGHCSGGRQAVLAACNVDVDAAVDCYGAYVVGNPPETHPMHAMKVRGLEEQLVKLRCPLLGLFGNEDAHPSPRMTVRATASSLPTGRPIGSRRRSTVIERSAISLPGISAADAAWTRRPSTSTILSTPRPHTRSTSISSTPRGNRPGGSPWNSPPNRPGSWSRRSSGRWAAFRPSCWSE